ncbi:MAG TPA: Asp-tRNA(Asn)/Glu-tRNA(Gln) amidotransferase subunit GatC [Patescibacteria group bacterium]|nr:Asp-tRNA(Asn)/Glu-tRNA(Gln) amidotransferase subunit GatC [Patescibacteria group bacterium]
MISKLADLSKLIVSKKEEGYFKKQFDETFKIINEFNKLDTSKVNETYIVTSTKNVLREDVIDSTRMLSQEEALSCSKRNHNGYFVVDGILNEE